MGLFSSTFSFCSRGWVTILMMMILSLFSNRCHSFYAGTKQRGFPWECSETRVMTLKNHDLQWKSHFFRFSSKFVYDFSKTTF